MVRKEKSSAKHITTILALLDLTLQFTMQICRFYCMDISPTPPLATRVALIAGKGNERYQGNYGVKSE